MFSSGQSDRGVKLATHLHVVPKLRTYGAVLPCPYMTALRVKRKLYLLLFEYNIFKEIGTCTLHRSDEQCTKGIIEKVKKRYDFGGQGLDKMMILKWVWEK
jgi:hypothetical protein